MVARMASQHRPQPHNAAARMERDTRETHQPEPPGCASLLSIDPAMTSSMPQMRTGTYHQAEAPEQHALCACSRFSASSQTADCGPSMTSVVTLRRGARAGSAGRSHQAWPSPSIRCDLIGLHRRELFIRRAIAIEIQVSVTMNRHPRQHVRAESFRHIISSVSARTRSPRRARRLTKVCTLRTGAQTSKPIRLPAR